MATASAISDAVTYKAVDILKIENYKLYYFGITFFALITPSAHSKPTLGALQSTCTVYHCIAFVHLFVCPSSICCCSAVLGVLAAAATIWPRPTPRDVDT